MKKSVKFSISQLNVNGKIVDDPTLIAEKLNKFFVNVGPETEKKATWARPFPLREGIGPDLRKRFPKSLMHPPKNSSKTVTNLS